MLIFLSVICALLAATLVIGAFIVGVRFGEGSLKAPLPQKVGTDKKAKTLLENIERYDGTAKGQKVVR